MARREELSLGRFVATSVKVMQDGVAENFTASMTQPYCDGHGNPTDNSGTSFVPPEVLLPAAAAAATADLVVLDRDPFADPPDEIGDTRVLQTFVDGRRAHAAPDA